MLVVLLQLEPEEESSILSKPIDNFDDLTPPLAEWENLCMGIPWIPTSGETEC